MIADNLTQSDDYKITWNALHTIKNELFSLLQSNPSSFHALYSQQSTATYIPEYMSQQLQLKLLRKISTTHVTSNYKIYRYHNLLFITDYKNDDTKQVFSPYDEEVNICAPFYIDNIKPNSQVLELGTGCGLYSILSATHGASALGIDVNPEAIDYAKFNAAMNLNTHTTNFRQDDLSTFFSKNKKQFDLIIGSLPYMPCHSQHKNIKLYANAGINGNTHAINAIKLAPNHLCIGGKFKMYTMSLGNQHSSYIENSILRKLKLQKFSIKLTKLYEKPTDFTKWYTNKYTNHSYNTSLWLKDLKDKNFHYMHYIMIEITADSLGKFETTSINYTNSIPYKNTNKDNIHENK